MAYTRLIIGDSSIARFWAAAQLARPQLMSTAFKESSCLETLASALSDVNDSLDSVLVAVLSDLIIEEASSADITASCTNIVGDVFRALQRAASRSANVQVHFGSSNFLSTDIICSVKCVLVVQFCS